VENAPTFGGPTHIIIIAGSWTINNKRVRSKAQRRKKNNEQRTTKYKYTVDICWLDWAINTIYLFIFFGALFQAADEKCFQRCCCLPCVCLFLFAIKTYTLKKNSVRCAAAKLRLRLGSRLIPNWSKMNQTEMNWTERRTLNWTNAEKQTKLKQKQSQEEWAERARRSENEYHRKIARLIKSILVYT